MSKLVRIASIMMFMTATATASASPTRPAVPGFGETHTAPEASEHPDPKLRYRVVFSVTKASAKADEVNPSLAKVARFLNLLAEDGVRPGPGDIVAVLHGGATAAVLSDSAYSARSGGKSNPNARLIDELRAAGVIVSVCSQALHAQNVASTEVLQGVRVDVSALTTVANLQLRGYALIGD